MVHSLCRWLGPRGLRAENPDLKLATIVLVMGRGWPIGQGQDRASTSIWDQARDPSTDYIIALDNEIDLGIQLPKQQVSQGATHAPPGFIHTLVLRDALLLLLGLVGGPSAEKVDQFRFVQLINKPSNSVHWTFHLHSRILHITINKKWKLFYEVKLVFIDFVPSISIERSQ